MGGLSFPEFQRRLADCPVYQDPKHEQIRGIVLQTEMVSAAAPWVARSSGSRTRLVPGGVLHAFDLVEMGEHAIELLVHGNPDSDVQRRQLAVYRRVCTDTEWADIESIASIVPTNPVI